jgi:hypothetical protein
MRIVSWMTFLLLLRWLLPMLLIGAA